MSGVYTIPLGLPFADVLAKGLLDRAGENTLLLPRTTVLLPTMRASRALREAFLRQRDTPLLLPRMMPLGELDADELTLLGGAEIPPAIAPLRRQALLAQALLKSSYAGNSAEALALARALARFLDEVQTEEVNLDCLEALVPEVYAEHWQKTLAFLGILKNLWPELLAIENAIDPATRRARVLTAQAELWVKMPPAMPIIIAGVTGSIPAVRALMHIVAKLPEGEVILPGLDQTLESSAWEEVDAVHPQYAMKAFIEQAKVPRKDVRLWSGVEIITHPRARLVGELFRPAATAERWHELEAEVKTEEWQESLRGLSLCECASRREEADAIAVLFRQILETPGKRAALVTPDRDLARQVVAALGRWNIPINDSAGMPLGATPPGAFLHLVAEMVASDFAPVALLACFKHPLALGGRPPGEFRTLTRLLERTLLRGQTPAPGLAGLATALEAPDIDAPARAALAPWLREIEALAAPLAETAEASAAEQLRAHVAFAEALATGAEKCGLWETENGEALAEFVADALDALAGFTSLAPREFPAFLTALMADQVVRPRASLHARLFIWGPIEARLQQTDLVVLGGLNEGTWPQMTAADPFLSRTMRAALGLPQAEQRIGLAAHDFAAGLAAPQIVLTRARLVDGAPTIPSRWLMRLEAVLKALNLELPSLPGGNPALMMQRLDLPPGPARPAAQPRPIPLVAVRPRRLSLTDVETWLADPYRLYAKHILRLKPLDPLAMEPGAADKGTLIHLSLDRFLKRKPAGDAYPALLAIGRAVFDEFKVPDAVRLLWWPRFKRVAAWFAETQTRREADGAKNLASEVKGSLQFDAPAGPFLLTAKIDRIDSWAEGLEIIDYKTGALPTQKSVAEGAKPQLPLGAAIIAAGGVKSVSGNVTRLSYWHIPGGEISGEEINLKSSPEEILERLKRHVAAFDDPATPYAARAPQPNTLDYHPAYAHLARAKEWAGGGEDDDA